MSVFWDHDGWGAKHDDLLQPQWLISPSEVRDFRFSAPPPLSSWTPEFRQGTWTLPGLQPVLSLDRCAPAVRFADATMICEGLWGKGKCQIYVRENVTINVKEHVLVHLHGNVCQRKCVNSFQDVCNSWMGSLEAKWFLIRWPQCQRRSPEECIWKQQKRWFVVHIWAGQKEVVMPTQILGLRTWPS